MGTSSQSTMESLPAGWIGMQSSWNHEEHIRERAAFEDNCCLAILSLATRDKEKTTLQQNTDDKRESGSDGSDMLKAKVASLECDRLRQGSELQYA